jgi:hypothetical protein
MRNDDCKYSDCTKAIEAWQARLREDVGKAWPAKCRRRVIPLIGQRGYPRGSISERFQAVTKSREQAAILSAFEGVHSTRSAQMRRRISRISIWLRQTALTAFGPPLGTRPCAVPPRDAVLLPQDCRCGATGLDRLRQAGGADFEVVDEYLALRHRHGNRRRTIRATSPNAGTGSDHRKTGW